MRLDEALVARGLAISRARAQAAVKDGCVTVNGEMARKPAQKVIAADALAVTPEALTYVSRGALKLAAALTAFNIDPKNKTCLDLGASTGGFTEVLLQKGARKIFAVDVGSGQLHPRIVKSDRVINLEKTHSKDLTRTLVTEEIELVVCDVSFISLKKALPSALALTKPDAMLVALVKPQFEVGPDNIGKAGIVRPARHNQEGVAEDISDWINSQAGWRTISYLESPIKGGDGNREFLIAASRET